MKRDYVYVSGPMTGIKDNNVPAFTRASATLRRKGYRVVNPAEYDTSGPLLTWSDCLRRDLSLMCEKCSAIALLPGWEKSRGATLEVYVGKKLGMRIALLKSYRRRKP